MTRRKSWPHTIELQGIDTEIQNLILNESIFTKTPEVERSSKDLCGIQKKKKTFKLSEVGQIIHAILNILSWTSCKNYKKMNNHEIETPRSTTNIKWWEKENPRSPCLRPNKVQGRNRMLSSSLCNSRAATVNKFTTKLIRTKTHTGKPGSVLAKELSSRQGKQLLKTSGMYTREWC